MPFESRQQQRYIFAAARKGEKWAKEYIAKARKENALHVKRKRKGQ